MHRRRIAHTNAITTEMCKGQPRTMQEIQTSSLENQQSIHVIVSLNRTIATHQILTIIPKRSLQAFISHLEMCHRREVLTHRLIGMCVESFRITEYHKQPNFHNPHIESRIPTKSSYTPHSQWLYAFHHSHTCKLISTWPRSILN